MKQNFISEMFFFFFFFSNKVSSLVVSKVLPLIPQISDLNMTAHIVCVEP